MPVAAGLSYEWHGPEDGEVVVLSSGLGGLGSYWAPNLPALAERFRVLTYDHRGTGGSEPLHPPRNGEGDRAQRGGAAGSTSVEAMADDLLALFDALGIVRAQIVGHALGGLIGMALALKAPDRVRSLLVLNGWGRLEPHTARCFDARLALLRDSGPEAFAQAQPIFLYPANWLAENEPPIHVPADPAVAEARILAAADFDPWDRLRRLDTPLLAASNNDDILVPSLASSALVEQVPGAAEVMLGWGGHASNVTNPPRFNAVALAWLADDTLPEV